VISEDGAQLVFILRFEKCFDRASGQLSECIVCGSEDREWPGAF
jgi:hypothetical protein